MGVGGGGGGHGLEDWMMLPIKGTIGINYKLSIVRY